ncbi:MAG: gamma-glutamyl-gamma-aminobutyrate hydrolase family protein [Oscillospiraceae bacterium]|nr:gamma-glutamyl-gamma-aminobutyrate hydrolase family protein [Oscillospiraceae bacterium]
MKKVIGIVPKGVLFDVEQPNFNDIYHLLNNYVKRVEEAGAIPVCLAPVDGRLSPEQLEMCDGFIAQGGTKMWPYHFQVIHHAATTGKRYLGVCLGMQLIHRYYAMKKMVEDMGLEGPVDENIIDLFYNKEKGHDLLHEVSGHKYTGMTREDTDVVKHDVDVVPGTVLHRLLGRDKARAASFHNYRVEDPVADLTVNAWACDGSGTIEGLENGTNILGVQFHPEVDDLLPEIFKFLTED